MPRPLNDSPYLYGLHDPGGEAIMADQNIFGWIMFTEELGSDPGNRQGRDYSPWAEPGFGIIARLNHGYEPQGTIPFSGRYAEFARRCAQFVAQSQGCHIWVIGNEMNHAIERPGIRYDASEHPPRILAPGEVIVPALYADCYRLSREAIKAVDGHADDQVIVGAVAPWNDQTAYAENPTGDWIKYLADVLAAIGPDDIDGISLHAYTHGGDPSLVHTDTFMQPPFHNRQFNFRVYQDFLRAVPPSMRALPVYLTETNQGEEWHNEDTGWVQRVYGEIDWWNHQPGTQKIRAVVLYRWPKGLDRWGLDGKPAVIDDLKEALAARYTWVGLEPPPVYLARFVSHDTPVALTAGKAASASLVILNRGTVTWQASGPSAVRLGYRWLDQADQVVTLPAGVDVFAALPATVAPGEQVTVTASPVAPAVGGAYTLEWDLYEEGKGWFSQQGSQRLAVKVAVEAPPIPVEMTFAETGKTARGAFAAFCRQYGVEITGYPISDEYVLAESGLPTQDWQRLVMEEYPEGKIRLRLVGEQLHALEATVEDQRKALAGLQAEIDRLLEGDRLPPPPPFTDIMQQLPRDEAGFVKRPPQEIKYVVISHTGVRPTVGADQLAEAHRARWPGAICQFFVTGDGQIQQTNPLDEVVAHDQSWLFNGINVYVAGNFNDTIPSPAQLDALASLVAWLLPQYRLDESAVRGACEFIATQSPGEQWLNGQRWKDLLLERVRGIMARFAGPRPGAVEALQAERAALQARVSDLQERDAAWREQVHAFQQRYAQVQEHVSTLSRGIVESGKVPVPAITDISQQMPHGADSLKARPADQIKYIVFNHSAVDGSVTVARIAAAHQKRWGAILYQYFITPDGQIQQTNAVDQVVDLSQPWIAQGINVAVAGDFTSDIPTTAQIDASARLTAWLMQQYAIPLENVKGASEFIATQSPGLQWTQGKAWKNLLLARVSEVQQGASTGTGTDADVAKLIAQINQLQGERDTLAAQVATLTADKASLAQQLQALGDEKTTLNQRITELEARIHLLEGGGTTTPASVPQPDMVDIVAKLPRHATQSYDTRTLDKITHIAIHHSAAAADVAAESVASYHVSKGWPGIGYHFYVVPDGTIYQTNHLETVSYQVYDANPYSLGICIAGTFTNVAPTPRQIAQVSSLVAWLVQKLNVPLEHVWGHREFPRNQTSCPGDQFLGGQKYKEQIMSQVRAALAAGTPATSKCIGHYVLFWQRQDAWAAEDWAAALKYIGRFRPTAGFSADDAAHAEYVTIVGAATGVSSQTETALTAAGCKVERIAGDDSAGTQRLLDEMADSGRRFKSFDA